MEVEILNTPFYSRRGNGLPEGKTVVSSPNKDIFVRKITESPDYDYDGFCIVTDVGTYEFKISSNKISNELTLSESSIPIWDITNIHISSFRCETLLNTKDIPSWVKEEFMVHLDDETNDNTLFFILTPSRNNPSFPKKDIYLSLNNIHTGESPHTALLTFKKRDETEAEEILRTYL